MMADGDQDKVLASLLQVLGGDDGRGLALRRLRIGPPSGSTPTPPVAARSPAWPEDWPRAGLPQTPLRPPEAIKENQPVVLVALFDLDDVEVTEAVRQLKSRQRDRGGFVPIILTDRASHSLFRRQGLLVEYFPAAIVETTERFDWFRERVARLWQKWNATALIDLSREGYLEPRTAGLPFMEPSFERTPAEQAWTRRATRPGKIPTPDVAALRAEADARGLLDGPDSFVLYRIIGNDPYPRHEPGQSLRNVRFILDHEAPLEGCERRWVLNRIIDREEEADLIALLEARGQSVLRIGFDPDAYAECPWDLEALAEEEFLLCRRPEAMSERRFLRAHTRARRHKINYAMNNNGARNAALQDGRGRARWILPWDGNCFVTEGAWSELRAAVAARRHLKYFVVPMERITETAQLFDAGFRPEATEEPQIMFRCDASEQFDDRFYYGRRPKVELFWRLGLPGPWDLSNDDRWDLPRPALSEEAGQLGRAGWVARLPSGMAELEQQSRSGQVGREEARNRAIIGTLEELDRMVFNRHFDPGRLAFYDESALAGLQHAEAGGPDAALRAGLLAEAEAALGRGPYSVVHKSSLPPSGNPHDYWHPAPYWWPNPATLDGLPFVRRDGERLPGTDLYDPQSDRYDRTRLQRLFDDTTMLALAWAVAGDSRFSAHAARLVRCWFIEPETRMQPHLQFAQVRPGHGPEEVSGSGIIEFKDLYFFLDAVRLLQRSEALGAADEVALRTWLATYLEWLDTSPQGLAERAASNNHGTCFDLQTAAIAAYLGDVPRLMATFRTSRERMLRQFDRNGAQPQEMARTQPLHYIAFNLQSWVNLAALARRCGDRLQSFGGPDGLGLDRALAWGLQYLGSRSAGSEFDVGRCVPLRAAAHDLSGRVVPPAPRPPLFHPHDGIAPFWMLGQRLGPPEENAAPE